jgi:hypothetical protein
MAKPLVIELFSGLSGWGKGALAEGYRVWAFDIADMCKAFGKERPAGIEFCQYDVLTMHGKMFKDADLILSSSPCQEFSYRAMPWKRAKALGPPVHGLELFNAQFRIQREASEAAGRHIPMVVENVKGAQPWVGRAQANFGSYFLWGSVYRVGNAVVAGDICFGQDVVRADRRVSKVPGMSWSGSDLPGYKAEAFNGRREHERAEAIKNNATGSWFGQRDGQPTERNDPRDYSRKNEGGSWFAIGSPGQTVTGQNPVNGIKVPGLENGRFPPSGLAQGYLDNGGTKVPGNNSPRRWEDREVKRLGDAGIKQEGSGPEWFDNGIAKLGSHSSARKRASAEIAQIPFELASYIARAFYPRTMTAGAAK